MCLAVPGKILSISGEDTTRTGVVSFGGAAKEASLAFVPEARVGDYVLVHAGFAISVLDEQEAQETLSLFAQMEEAARREEEELRARQEGDQANPAAEEKPDQPTTRTAP